MPSPTLTTRIDWWNNGTFTAAIDSCVGRVLDADWKRGRSADFNSEATGQATFTLDNFDDAYTPDRQWHANPSFEDGTTGYSVAAIASLTAAATSITQVVDNATAATGVKAGEAVLTATINSGVTYSIPYRFRSGVTYAASVWLKSVSGSLNVRAGFASSGTPADIATTVINITAAWARYRFTWTPSTDRSDGVFFVRTTTAAAATVRIDGCQVNTGSMAAYGALLRAMTGLVSYWRLGEETPGTGTAKDSFGANNGTYVASPTGGVTGALTGDGDTAVTFNGTTQYVTVAGGATLNVGDTFTLMAWVKRSAVGANSVIVSGPTNSYTFYFDTANRLTLARAAVAPVIVSTGALVDTVSWHQVVVTKAGAASVLYLDGAIYPSNIVNLLTIVTGATDVVTIGRDGPTNSLFFPGSLDEVAIFNRALTADEVAALYAAAPAAPDNTYIEAPTKGQLVPGRPVHIYATNAAVDYPQFYGFIQRLTPNYADRTVAIVCYDGLPEMANRNVTVPTSTISRSVREIRRQILDEFERGNQNLATANPSFETNTTGWTASGCTLTRITTDSAVGVASGEIVLSGASGGVTFNVRTLNATPAGELYRASLYVKLVSGAVDYQLRIWGQSTTVPLATRNVTATTGWVRETVVGSMDVSIGGSVTPPLRVTLTSNTQSVGTVRIDGLMVTVGAALWPYADLGSGRWKNLVDNGDFESGVATGWTDAYTNLCTNPSFEGNNTTGWSVAGDAFTYAATSIAADGTAPYVGAFSAKISGGDARQGAFFALSGTFKSGVPYRVRMAIKDGTNGVIAFGIGSNGTPADVTPNSTSSFASWAVRTVTWTPSADRTDAHVFVVFTIVTGASSAFIDAVEVTRAMTSTDYVDTGPNGGGSFATAIGAGVTNPNTGLYALDVTTAATAGSGVVYDLYAGIISVGAAFPPIAHTLSLSIRVDTGTASVKIGISANKTNATMDEVSTTLTATTTYQRVTLTWTPTAERLADVPQRIVLTVWQTDAVARHLYIDSVRLTPGASADSYEMAQWSLPNGGESGLANVFQLYAAASGSVLSLLTTLNAMIGSRHYIKPTMTTPWYQYMVIDRDAAAVSAETFNDDIADMTVSDIDRAAIVNVQKYSLTNVTRYYSDAASVGTYGVRLGTDITTSAWTGVNQNTADTVGAAIVARLKDPHPRPVITVVNRWPSQLQRELGDLITVNFGRLRIASGRYFILHIDTKVSEASQRWETAYTLEEQAY